MPGEDLDGAEVKLLVSVVVGGVFTFQYQHQPRAGFYTYQLQPKPSKAITPSSLIILKNIPRARCSSLVRAFDHGAMGRRIDPP